MKRVAAGNPKLVHGGDRLKEIEERIKRDEADPPIFADYTDLVLDC
jgi:hypothetical protein